MGVKLTPEILRLMSPEDQQYYGFVDPGIHTKDEAHPPVKTGTTERREQGEFWNWLCLHGYDSATIWHRTDKATGATKGCPDFIVPTWSGAIYIEFKVAGSWLSEAQEAFREGLENKGILLHVCFSSGEAISLIRQKDRLE